MPLRSGLSVLLVGLVVSAGALGASQDSPRERQVRAAFLFNVLKFVDWPVTALPAASQSLVVAVLAPEDQSEMTTALEGKAIKGRTLAVRGIRRAEDIGPSNVVLVTAEASAELRDALRATQGRPVLTVSEQTGSSPTSAIITIAIVEAKLAFHVNLDAADAAGLQLSSNLLGLAKSVQSQRLKAGRP